VWGFSAYAALCFARIILHQPPPDPLIVEVHPAGEAALAKRDAAMWRARDAQVPMGHMGDAWDVANAALFLASDESRYVTGSELAVDGGTSA